MVALLIWLLGALAFGYEIAKHGFWQVAVANLVDMLFVLWIIGGAAALSARLGGGRANGGRWERAAAALRDAAQREAEKQKRTTDVREGME